MTNKETLIAAMDNFIVNSNAFKSGGIPFIHNVMAGISIPAGMTFTLQDIADVANYFLAKYPGYYTYDEWYNPMVESLQPEPSNGTIPVVAASNNGKTILIIGAVVILIALLSVR